MPTQISFTADESLKEKALDKAKKEGITLKALLTFSMRAFIEGKIKLGVTSTAEPEVEEIIFQDEEIKNLTDKLESLLK